VPIETDLNCQALRIDQASQACLIGVERRDLGLAHALACEPLRNVDVAEPLDVGEHLIRAGAGNGAGGPEGIAHQHQARLLMAAADGEVGRADLDLA